MNVALSDTDLVFQAVSELRQIKRNMSACFLAYGKRLHELGVKRGKDGEKKNAPYKLYAPHITNQSEFSKELGMSVSTLHNIVDVYLDFGHILIGNDVLLEIYPTRLIRLIPLHLKEEEKAEWLYRASEYTPQAFQNSINERKGKVTTDECEHDDEPWVKCKVCGDLRKV